MGSQRLILAALLVLLARPVPGAAAPQGTIDLAWNECAVTSATANRVFACNSDAGLSYLAGMFTLSAPITDFEGAEGILMVTVAGPTLPSWWQFGSGACRAGAIQRHNPSQLPGCVKATNPFGSEDGWALQQAAPNPYQTVLRFSWGSTDLASLSTGVRYAGFVGSISHIYTVGASPSTGGACAGCSQPACIELTAMTIYGDGGGQLTQAGARKFVTWQGGADGHGACPGAVPVNAPTWGGIKSLYR
jgi:hypothetical protein